MKKIGLIIFIFALAVGIVVANFFSVGSSFLKSPISMSFGKVQGSGNFVTEKRIVSSFKNVDISGIFEVEITAQKDFSVEVEADDNLLSLIKTQVSGDTLSIESDKKFSSNQRVKIRISAPDIENLDVSGVSNTNLSNLNNQSLKIDSSGASKINVAGRTDRLVIDSSGASRIDTQSLEASDVSIEARGASQINVDVSDVLSADLSGASHVNYSGNPTEINKKTSGASCLKQHK